MDVSELQQLLNQITASKQPTLVATANLVRSVDNLAVGRAVFWQRDAGSNLNYLVTISYTVDGTALTATTTNTVVDVRANAVGTANPRCSNDILGAAFPVSTRVIKTNEKTEKNKCLNN
jgi:hypothetical protein